MIDHQIGDGPIEPKFKAKMEQLASALDKYFNGDLRGEHRKVGFVTLIFDFNSDAGRCNYISNSDRVDVMKLMREQLAYFEAKQKSG